MRVLYIIGAVLLGFCGFLSAQAQEIGKSGAPLPRFVSLAADKTYMRAGPGRQYPIEWSYQRKNLPMKVIDEYGPWRKVVDFEGVTGWIHRQLLSPRRIAMIIGGPQVLRIKPALSAKINARLQENVLTVIEECGVNWCKLVHPQVTGWLPRAGIYGVLEGEIFD